MSNKSATPSVIDSLHGVDHVRPFPIVATKIMKISENEDLDFRELAEIIQCDPALTLQLMRVANSSMYGFSGQIRSIDHAVVVLGAREVTSLSVSIATGELFCDGENAGAALWNHSLGCAAVARSLAKFVPSVSPGEAFLAGILHDVGKLVFFDVVPIEYAKVTKDLGQLEIHDIEHEHFGTSHQEVGQHCAEEWGLAVELHDVIRFHHSFDDAHEITELLNTVATANFLSRAWGIGADSPHAIDSFSKVYLDLSEPELKQVQESAVAGFQALTSAVA